MGLLDWRRRQHAHDCEVAYRLLEVSPPPYEAVAEWEKQPGDLDPAALVPEGRAFAEELRGGGTPSMEALHHWQRRTRVCIKILKDTDPQAVLDYMDSLESARDVRLIRSSERQKRRV